MTCYITYEGNATIFNHCNPFNESCVWNGTSNVCAQSMNFLAGPDLISTLAVISIIIVVLSVLIGLRLLTEKVA